MTTALHSDDDRTVAEPGPLRVAVIGAGPAGIYAVGALLEADPAASVDVFEALPAPFGLVRYGVAPDRPKMRSVATKLAEILASPRVRFLGNVAYGTDLTGEDLRRHYHAVIHASGSPNERALGIPGEDLDGSFAAADFVAWYNGHPGATDQGFLDARDVVVVGAGNVALDVARMLLTDAEALVATDLPADVLDAWGSAQATDVYLLARRGPAFAKFTTPELRELADLEGVGLIVDPADLELDPASAAVLVASRAAKRNVAVLQQWAAAPAAAPRRMHFSFWARPTEIHGSRHVEGVTVERTRLDDTGRLVATGATERVSAKAVFRAIGYAGTPVPGLPFDEAKATVPNSAGRVTGAGQAGRYVAGWIKRGPVGVIGTNKSDAAETVRSLLADAPTLRAPPEPDPAAVLVTLDRAGVRYFGWDEWLRLDAYEVTEGERRGRPRVKVRTVDQMLDIGTRRTEHRA
jgi:ferredoxin--NADP+ reductase